MYENNLTIQTYFKCFCGDVKFCGGGKRLICNICVAEMSMVHKEKYQSFIAASLYLLNI